MIRTNKKQVEQGKIIEEKIRKLLSDVMRIIGVICLISFGIVGAYFYYFKSLGSDPIRAIFMASTVVLFLSLMTQVKDKW